MMSNEDRARHEERLINASYFDYLTGLPSMTYFFELAETARREILKDGGHPVMLYMDMSGMKFFNRTHGFAAGDKLLCAFADALSDTFGQESCSRFGNDHFVAFTTEDGLEETLDLFLERCRDINSGINLPVRIGVYKDSLEEVDVSSACDRAKYACDSLRNTYVSSVSYFNEDLLEKARRRQYIIEHFDRALNENWIKVYYQPIVRSVNGRVCDEEALARWIDPDRGLLPPSEFVPILEETRLIYKLDLYVVDQVINKLKTLTEAGLHIVPQSVNLSRSDFDSCDVVEEIRKRVDAAGLSRSMLTIEVTESMIGEDFEFMKAQIERFQELGFSVWMDDFGSGYSSLDVLQSIQFQLIKFDMHFLQNLDKGDSAKIILSELMRMATALGTDTVSEGVETEEQVNFLQEIGCSKLQGYYFEKPIPVEKILEKYRKGYQIGFEDPKDSPYYETVGRINLHDLSVIAHGTDEGSLHDFFNMLPMAIIELDKGMVRFARMNQSYKDFFKRIFGFVPPDAPIDLSLVPEGSGLSFVNAVLDCDTDGSISFIDELMPDNFLVHSVLRCVAHDPDADRTSVVVCVLSIKKADKDANYISIAKALAADYFNLYYVDLETDDFTEYSSEVGEAEVSVERHGKDFFNEARRGALEQLYPADRKAFISSFTKDHILKELKDQGTFTLTYRLLGDGEPVYANMKAMHMQENSRYLIIGVRNVDSQMKQQEAYEKARRDQIIASRMMALSGSFLCIYSVDTKTDDYTEYNSSSDYKDLGIAQEGSDFFAQAQKNGLNAVYPDDLPLFQRLFTKEHVMKVVSEQNIFVMQYRLVIGGEIKPIRLRAMRVNDDQENGLIIALSGVDEEDLYGQRPRLSHQQFVNSVDMPCCVMSVTKGADGKCGDLRIVKANQSYKDTMGPAYYDNMPYYELVPKDSNFEDFCYRAAILKQRMHAYVEVKAMNCWIDQTLIPLATGEDGTGYCQFIFEYTYAVEADRLANVSVDNAGTIIQACIKLMGSEDFQSGVGDVLELINNATGAKGTRVMLIDHAKRKAIVFSERIDESAWPTRVPGKEIIGYEMMSRWEDDIGDSNVLIVDSESGMDALAAKDPGWVADMRKHGVKNLVLIPLRRFGETLGYLFVTNYDDDKTVEVKELLELMSFFLGSEISNHMLVQRLEDLSQKDELTGVHNRRAMINHMRQISAEASRPFGVVNIDLNGLKTANDTEGHETGDRLLVQAGEILSKVFYEDDIFRTGGDEFIILSGDIVQETFDRKVSRLRADVKKNGEVSFAIGDFWSDGSVDLTTAMRLADERMYSDKEAFYENHPELKRN